MFPVQRKFALAFGSILTTWHKGPPPMWHHVGIIAAQTTRGEATVNAYTPACASSRRTDSLKQETNE
jgi:hypothetical protein